MFCLHNTCKFFLYALRDYLDIIKHSFEISKLGSLLLMVDTNARTGIGRDFIDYDDKHIPISPDTYKSMFTKERDSQDLHVCPRG